jgi:hypothetical protein
MGIESVGIGVIQAPKLEPRNMRNELTEYEWSAIRPFLPNRPRGVPRVNDRRVLNGSRLAFQQALTSQVATSPRPLPCESRE